MMGVSGSKYVCENCGTAYSEVWVKMGGVNGQIYCDSCASADMSGRRQVTTPRAVYEQIAAEMPEGLAERVLAVLKGHVGKGQRIGRHELVAAVFGEAHGIGLSEVTKDRQVRLAIESLREKHPILSSSGNGGYWMAGSLDELNEYMSEVVSRSRKLEAQARMVKTWTLNFSQEQLFQYSTEA